MFDIYPISTNSCFKRSCINTQITSFNLYAGDGTTYTKNTRRIVAYGGCGIIIATVLTFAVKFFITSSEVTHILKSTPVIDRLMLVVEVCEKSNIKSIALSGGVFMNRVLTELCIDKLRKKGYNVYINRQVPTNDGGISIGQAYIMSKKVK